MNWNNGSVDDDDDDDGVGGRKSKVSVPVAGVQVMSAGGRPAAVQPASSVTITDPLRQHFHRASSSSSGPPNLIVNWVNRLEKLNATLDEAGGAPPGSINEAQHRHSTSAAAATVTATPQLESNRKQAIVTIVGGEQQREEEDDDDDETESRDFCFKAAQLITEFLLMLFAAGLLVIAAIVIFSKRIPDFMQSYEIVPKFLFFTCLVVAGYSFLSWSMRKISANWRGGGSSKDDEKSQPEVTSAARYEDSTNNKQAPSRRLSFTSDGPRAGGAHKRSSLQEPLLAHYSPTRESHRRPELAQTTSLPRPPTRQVAFDVSPAHTPSGGEQPAYHLTIDEESDQEQDVARPEPGDSNIKRQQQ